MCLPPWHHCQVTRRLSFFPSLIIETSLFLWAACTPSLGHVITCLSLASLFLAVMLKQKHTVSQRHDSLAVLLWESSALREGFSDGEMSSRVPMTPD